MTKDISNFWVSDRYLLFTLYIQPTDEHKIIACLSIRKSPGYIDIPLILIKEAKLLLAPHLAKLFNECIKSGTCSDLLKVAKVIPLHKSGSKLT